MTRDLKATITDHYFKLLLDMVLEDLLWLSSEELGEVFILRLLMLELT